MDGRSGGGANGWLIHAILTYNKELLAEERHEIGQAPAVGSLHLHQQHGDRTSGSMCIFTCPFEQRYRAQSNKLRHTGIIIESRLNSLCMNRNLRRPSADKPPVISRKLYAYPSWQTSMATNCFRHSNRGHAAPLQQLIFGQEWYLPNRRRPDSIQ